MSSDVAAPPRVPRRDPGDAGGPAPEWRPYVDAWNDLKERVKVSRGDCEGREYLAAGPGLVGNILKFYLAERMSAGGISSDLEATARSILARHAPAVVHQVFEPGGKVVGTDTFVDSPPVVEAPDGRRYWLTTGPFYFRPGATPGERPVKHPGVRRGEAIGVVPVPEPVSTSGALPPGFEVA